MDIIIPLLIVSVLIGIPTWLIVQTVNKADKSTIIYSPEEVTRRLRKGFYLSFWGMDLLFGAIPSFVLILCDLPTVFQFIVPAVAFVVGFIMFFIGRIQVGLMTRHINFCNRERTEFEEWVLQAMLGIEEVAMRRNGINVITKVIPGVTDDMLSAMNSMGKKGSRAYYKDFRIEEKGFQVSTIETTGAGDTFCGCSLAYILEHDINNLTEDHLREMLIFANAGAALVTTKKGAICSMPERREIVDLIDVSRNAIHQF